VKRQRSTPSLGEAQQPRERAGVAETIRVMTMTVSLIARRWITARELAGREVTAILARGKL